MTARPITDTAPSAAEAQIRTLRSLPAPYRLELAVQMSLTARALLTARLRTRYPHWSDEEICRESLRLTLPGAVLPPTPR